ncbi:hypothetical protein BC834DRAFT_574954 [Gloeopeniophorella convolvens]|nr:hypothetical protein BC834DRAFT_574954 [Gloeopeniophorella convolvens]
MFICRFRRLPRLAAPSLSGHVIVTQRTSSRATTPSQPSLSLTIPRYPNPLPLASAFDHTPPPHIDILHRDSSTECLTSVTDEQPTLTTTTQQEKENKVNPLPPLTCDEVRTLALRAQKARHTLVLDNLARNILGSPEPQRARLATTLFSIPHLGLSPSLTTSLSHCIIPSHLSSLSLDVSTNIALAITDKPLSSDTELLLPRLTAHITRRLKPLRKIARGRPATSEHAALIWSLFRLVINLSRNSLRGLAMDLLQVLIETSYVPPEAIRRADHSAQDFQLIITLTLVRSCLFWDWNSKALALLRDYLSGSSSAADPIISGLCRDVLYLLMEFPSVGDLGASISLVREILSRPKPFAVSPGIIRQIYSNAHHLDEPELAANFYAFTLERKIRSRNEHPLPSGSALTWLLQYLSKQTKRFQLARRFVREVVDRCEPIPIMDQASFISLVAESGFSTFARTLWERCSSGVGGRLVVGNAGLLIRMCSLFGNMSRRKACKGPEGLAEETVAEDLESLVPVGAPKTLSAEGLNIGRRGDEDEKELRDFANLVLIRYRREKEPLNRASREDLNALARANIILGHTADGLQALQVVTDRHERPDLYDVNVALSAIAKVDPRAALQMVERLVTAGPKPDGVSYGTVIHHAARHRDAAVIGSMLELAAQTRQQLTAKTVNTIIRASVAFSDGDKAAVRDNLLRALQVLAANADSSYLPTMNMGRFCVDEALKAGDAQLAFHCWKRLLRPKAQWTDVVHKALRRRIVEAVIAQCEKGDLPVEEGHQMVTALR